VATGVKCHVSCDMALMEVEGAPSSFENTRIPSAWEQRARDCAPNVRRLEWNRSCFNPVMRTLELGELCLFKEQL